MCIISCIYKCQLTLVYVVKTNDKLVPDVMNRGKDIISSFLMSNFAIETPFSQTVSKIENIINLG